MIHLDEHVYDSRRHASDLEMSWSCCSLSRDWRAETESEGDREYSLPVTDESFPSARAVQ